MMKKKNKVYFSDLKKLFKKSIVIIADYNDVITCNKNINEKAFIQPHNIFLYSNDVYATIVIFKNKIKNIDDFCLTLLHELIHLWLYAKDIYDHDEEFIENEAKRIYELEKKSILRFVNKYFSSEVIYANS